MIEIDGSVGEGGGQILRTALSLSLCSGKPFKLTHIRANRSKPGLLRQHMACVKAALSISRSTATGADLGATSLTFEPGPIRPGDYAFEIGSAGSCMLVLQTVIPPLLAAGGESQVSVIGGTHNPKAPPFPFLLRSWIPLVRQLGCELELTLFRNGFYPAGGGEVECMVRSIAGMLRPFDLTERGKAEDGYLEILAPGLPRYVSQREHERFMATSGWRDDQIRRSSVRANEGPGNAMIATLPHANLTTVFSEIGSKSVMAETVADRLAGQVRRHHAEEGALDDHLADQWTLPLTLAVWQSGRAARYTCTALTPHAMTNFDIIQRFVPVRITATEVRAGLNMVTIDPPAAAD
ncbi:RNA 3'-terminal phosphate cyclase [Hydrogenophaga sp. 5NK40-0174]|uniref:RNA 3'-terminal phosphate cyclase n=1 Tax=Hydrogenophaga sp. 5NK40-0174 TaxID=3127649 RepID=UPI003109305C